MSTKRPLLARLSLGVKGLTAKMNSVLLLSKRGSMREALPDPTWICKRHAHAADVTLGAQVRGSGADIACTLGAVPEMAKRLGAKQQLEGNHGSGLGHPEAQPALTIRTAKSVCAMCAVVRAS